MILAPGVCVGCGKAHNRAKNGRRGRDLDSWAEAEGVRQQWSQATALPNGSVGWLMGADPDGTSPYWLSVYDNLPGGKKPTNRTDTWDGSWDDYHSWLVSESHVVRSKDLARFVTNLTVDKRRQEHNQVFMARIYFDCDDAGTWDQLKSFFDYYGIAAIFSESSSSVRRRTQALAAGLPEPPITSWHVEIPLSQRVWNLFCGKALPDDQRAWRHYATEFKRAYKHLAGVFSALAGFPGVGKGPDNERACGFDLATNQMCIPRFLASKFTEDGPEPVILRSAGNAALAYEALLAGTGFVYEPLTELEEKVKTVSYTLPSGRRRSRRIVSHDRQLYADVKARIDCDRFLQLHVGCHPTSTNVSGGNYYFCPIHGEQHNPSRLSTGPHREGFHVFTGDGGESRWKCHGDCSAGGDVIHLAAGVWRVGVGSAVRRLAELLGMDLKNYLTRAEPAPGAPPLAAEEEPEPEGFEDQEQPAPEDRVHVRKATTAEVYAPLADWIEENFLDVDRAGFATRALARFLMEPEGAKALRKAGVPLVLQLDPERVAATIYSVMHGRMDEAQALGEVYEAVDRILKDREGAARGWLRRNLGPVPMHLLAGAMWRTAMAEGQGDNCTYWENYRRCLRFDLMQVAERYFLYQKSLEVWGNRSAFLAAHPEAASVWSGDDDEEIPEVLRGLQKKLKGFKALRNQARRPTGCKRFHHDLITTLGQDGGQRPILCQSRWCSYCEGVRAAYQWDLVLPKWKVFEKTPGMLFCFDQIVVKPEQLDELRALLVRVSRPKCLALGMTPDGNVVVTYVSKNESDRCYIYSALQAWYGRETVIRRRKGVAKRKGWECESATEALGYFMEQKLSLHAYGRHLIHDKREDILEFFEWAGGRHSVVARGTQGLPWVTLKEVAEAAKAKRDAEDQLDLAEGEKILYKGVHTKTGIVIGVQEGRPFTIDQIQALAVMKPEIQAAMRRDSSVPPMTDRHKASARFRENRQARARAPA